MLDDKGLNSVDGDIYSVPPEQGRYRAKHPARYLPEWGEKTLVGLWESLVEKPEVLRFRGQMFFGEFPELPVFCNRENAFVYPNRS